MAEQKKETTPASEAPLTAATLKERHPNLHAEVVKQGVDAERARVAAIRARSKHIDPELVDQALAEGWSETEATTRFLNYMQERKEARLSVLRTEHSETNGVTDPEPEVTEFDEANPTGSKKAAAELAAMPDGEEKWRAQYEKHGDAELGLSAKELRNEFSSVETYVAYKKHPERESA